MSRNRNLTLLSAVVAGLMSFPFSALAQSGSTVGIVSTIHGQAEAKETRLRFRDELKANVEIRTLAGSTAEILLRGAAVLTIVELSDVAIKEDSAGRIVVELRTGKVTLAVSERHLLSGEEIFLQTPTAKASVRRGIVIAEVKRTPAAALPGVGRPIQTASHQREITAPPMETVDRFHAKEGCLTIGSLLTEDAVNVCSGQTLNVTRGILDRPFEGRSSELMDVMQPLPQHLGLPFEAKEILIGREMRQAELVSQFIVGSPKAEGTVAPTSNTANTGAVIPTTLLSESIVLRASLSDIMNPPINLRDDVPHSETPAPQHAILLASGDVLDTTNNYPIFSKEGTATQLDTQSGLILGTQSLFSTTQGSLVFTCGASTASSSSCNQPAASGMGASISAGGLVIVDTALIEATRPLANLHQKTTMTSNGDLVALLQKAHLKFQPPSADTLIRLDASTLTVNGSLYNVTGGSFLNVANGYLAYLNNGSILNINNGAFVTVRSGSVFSLNNGSLAAFGPTGVNAVNINNPALVCGSCVPIGGGYQALLTGGATAANVSASGFIPFVGVGGNNSVRVNGVTTGALPVIVVDGPTTQVVLK